MSDDLKIPMTGYISNGGVLTLGPKAVEEFTTVTIDRPSRVMRILIDGELSNPSASNVPISVSFYDGTMPLFSAVGVRNVQGQSSQGALKKNYNLKLRRPSDGKKLYVKMGDWSTTSTITLKGYGTDRTLIRETTATALWRQIHAHPDGLLAPMSAYRYWDRRDCGMHLRATFSTDGLPCELWWNGAFQELVVWRSRTTNDEYLMDDSNRMHILIQAQHTWNVWDRDFDSRDWTVQSPEIDGYEEQEDISAKAPDVQAACERLFKWFQACRADEAQLRGGMHQYLHVRSWLDYLIMINVTGSYDSLQNNLFLGTWDGERWSVWPFDHDRTFGVTAWQDRAAAAPNEIGWITMRGGTADQDPGIFDIIQRNLRPELRARWAELRQAGIILTENLTRIIRRQVALIGGDSMSDDLENWSRGGENTVRPDLAYDGRWSVSYIQEWFRGRVAWMDAQWGFDAAR